ncbi:MAG: LuxR C-terminal-related transcriptional regulator [Sphingomonadales bacterium]
MHSHHIWVVDKSKLFREGLKMLLKDSPFEVTCEVANMAMLEDNVDCWDKPALILVALQTALSPGSEEEIVLNRICHVSGDAPVVVLSDAMSISQLKAAMKAGASGYLLRDITPDALKQSLLLVMLGEKVLPTDLVRILVDGCELRIPANGDVAVTDLSPREMKILSCLAHGRPNKVIANELSITEGTVKVHIKAVFKKIRARNRTEAAIWALNHGFDAEA